MKLLHAQFDALQIKHGAEELNSVYGGGCEKGPDFCFVFMNPTGRNIASSKTWEGIRYPWLGTKNIWKLFAEIGIVPTKLNAQIQLMKARDWTPDFCEKVYNEIRKSRIYVTNLAKCTQVDARYLDDKIYKDYLELFKKEMLLVKPKVLVLFGNQVSSVILDRNIKVSEERKREHLWNGFKTYSVFYPIGNGLLNLPKATEDLKYILIQEKIMKRDIQT